MNLKDSEIRQKSTCSKEVFSFFCMNDRKMAEEI